MVSIIVPLYNAESYISATIQSVIKQTYKDWELIIINDGSTDKSVEKIEPILSQDDRIKLLSIPNAGVSSARNYGMSLAKGSFIAFLDADDIWHKDKLEVQVTELAKHSNLYWSISNCNTINEAGSIIKKNVSKQPNTNNHFNELITWSTESFIAMSGLLIQSSLKDKIQFNQKISSPADRDFMIKLSKFSNALYIEQSLWSYRILSNSMSRQNLAKIADDMKAMYEDYTDDFFGNIDLKYSALRKINYILYRTYFRELRLMVGVISWFKYCFYSFKSLNFTS